MITPRANMTRWYSVPRLLDIGIRVVISTVFGEFADRRDSLAAERPLDPKNIDPVSDYSAEGREDFWLDYVADVGDGWDSTYAIAQLLAAPQLTPTGSAQPLPRARLLVMGGDEVYPTPSREDYEQKLVAPYIAASQKARDWPAKAPDLYAAPGNHDWYDGLSAFLNLFCWRQLKNAWSDSRNGHRIGKWQTQQTRSYFALKLPHDWWLWGTDIQLTNYIDQQQMNYFEHVAREWMPENARLILCAGVPDWVYADSRHPEKTFSHFSFIEGLLYRVGRGQHLCAILTGDSHHYSRYTEDDRHYITAGGGGAFLHPTHQLPLLKEFAWDWPRPNPHKGPPPLAVPPGQSGSAAQTRQFEMARSKSDGKLAVFPSRATSALESLKCAAFALYNWDFALATGLICAIFAWQLDGVARTHGQTLPLALSAPADFGAALLAYGAMVVSTPWPLLMFMAAVGAYCYFADFSSWWVRGPVGVTNTVAQIAPVALLTVALARVMPASTSSGLLILLVGIAGGIVISTVMGLYLLACLSVAGRHWNEAFSALRIRRYKNFLRLRIGSDGKLTIFPIGLTNVPRDVPWHTCELEPHLIEPPISVPADDQAGQQVI